MKKILQLLIFATASASLFGQKTEKFVQKNNEIALKLYAEFAKKAPGHNFVFSPFSIYMTYAALYASADGGTASGIRRAAGFSSSQDSHESQMAALAGGLKKASLSGDFSLNDFRLFWVEDDIEISPDFRGELKADFDTMCVSVDFEKSKRAVASMNALLAGASKNMMKDSVKAGHASDGMVFIVQNANSFSGKLNPGFGRSNTEKGQFTNAEGKQVAAAIMHSDSAEYNFVETDGFKAIKLPYAGGRLSLILICPDKDTTPAGAVALLSPSKTVQMLKHLGSKDCPASTVAMPRFRLDMPTLKIEPFLQSAGIGAIFNASADFSRLSAEMKAKKVDAYLNKSSFALEENGQTVPKVKPKTGLFGIALRHTNIDRPFAFMLVDNQTNAIYFMGCLADPTKS